jgi:pyruvate ferredoxin oxidoreductase gamma subunit
MQGDRAEFPSHFRSLEKRRRGFAKAGIGAWADVTGTPEPVGWHAIGTCRKAMVLHVRFHGRGGEGVKLASRIVSRAGFLTGLTVQDSPLYGAERRGAPVVAFTRLSPGPILERGYIEQAEVVVVMDQTLLSLPDAAVLSGVDSASLVLVNSSLRCAAVKQQHGIAGRVITFDVSSIALENIGRHLLSAAMAGLVTRVLKLAPWDVLAQAVRMELAAAGVIGDLLERNLAAARRVFDRAPELGVSAMRHPRPDACAAVPVPFVVPHLPARVAAPSISRPATSAARSTSGWRVYRPVIELQRCTRCFLCFALCPEGAIRLDAASYPVIDYEHCKGCLICAHECPPQVISQVREAAA